VCPVFLRIGSFVIYWYGVMAALGILVAGSLFQKLALKAGYSQKVISEILLYVVVCGLLGARIVHVMTHLFYYHRHPWEIFQLRNGGLAIQGAVGAAIFFLLIYSAVHSLSFFQLSDLVARVTPLGQAIGRLGCFLHGCCYGRPTLSPLSIHLPLVEGRVHPTQLYYFSADMAAFGCLWYLSRYRLRSGTLFCLYLMLMGLIRYNVDFLRGDLALTRFDLYPTQLLGIFLFLSGGLCLIWLLWQPSHLRDNGSGISRDLDKEGETHGKTNF